MTKISLYSLTLVLMGLLSLSTAHPIGIKTRGMNGRVGNELTTGEDPDEWSGGQSKNERDSKPSLDNGISVITSRDTSEGNNKARSAGPDSSKSHPTNVIIDDFSQSATLSTTPKQIVASFISLPGDSTVAKSTNRVPTLSARDHSGKATWYNPGLGSCGGTDSDSDLIVALATGTMSGGKHCNKRIKITDNTGKTTTATVRDTCPSCGSGDLDMSPAVFKKFRSLDVGVFEMKWNFD